MTDDRFYEQALRRIGKAMIAIAAGGLIVASAWGGWTYGVGFALGGAVSWLNFRWLRQIVDALGATRPTRKRVAILAGMRYALLGGGAYVILRYSSVNLMAAMVGLFVAVAAVIVEICFELVYGRND